MPLPTFLEAAIINSIHSAIECKTGSSVCNIDIDLQISQAIRDIESGYESGYISGVFRWRTRRWINGALSGERGQFYTAIIRSLETLL